ncbi:hypothetical protein LJB82_03925, partial [Desulfovibrio sp. OttesenSCG-928-M16]|nr:hypothetical protein [Desulfovibrio sp. OttesenSCG-928-M16]
MLWQALPDRERITINMKPSEGMAGKVARIAPTGVIIPFSDVPPGLLLSTTPEGATLFKGTQQQGRSLVLVTQHPEFGFVVSTQEPTRLSVDFFHNALGARWKATSAAPTTELPPEQGLGPIAEADAVSQALESDPQGIGEASSAAAAESNATPDAALDAAPVAPPQAQTEEAAPSLPREGAPDSDRPRPVVVQLGGTPEHASRVTR